MVSDPPFLAGCVPGPLSSMVVCAVSPFFFVTSVVQTGVFDAVFFVGARRG